MHYPKIKIYWYLASRPPPSSSPAVADFAKNEKVENFQIFDGNHGLNLQSSQLPQSSQLSRHPSHPTLQSPQLYVVTLVIPVTPVILILESKNALFLSRIIIVKHIQLADFAKNKNLENFQIFDRNHGLTLLEKSRFFDFFNFLILESKTLFFLSRILSNTFCWLFLLPKIKGWKVPFFYQNHGVTPWKNADSFTFLTF